MDAKHQAGVPGRVSPPPAAAELIIQNGRLKGTVRPLTLPLTIIGRSAGCDLRLNVEGIEPIHCCLAYGAEGLVLRDMPGTSGTKVNGQSPSQTPLRSGDLLQIGPFQFQVRLQGLSPAQQVAALQARQVQEKDALRIQAAAVAAQQAALAEEEARLQQRRLALEQQEEQLARHLDTKRCRLEEIRDQARKEVATLRAQRSAHETRVRETHKELEEARRQVQEDRHKVQNERQRLAKLVQRLKRRWQKQWASERAALERREEAVARRQREIDHERERLHKEREALYQARLRFNGEVELGRRQLQADWEAFRQEQFQVAERWDREHADLRERSRALNERAAALAEAEQALDKQKQEWQQLRMQLEREAEGLDHRIRNYRRKLADLEKEVAVLETQAANARATQTASPAPEGGNETQPSDDKTDGVAWEVLQRPEPAVAEPAPVPTSVPLAMATVDPGDAAPPAKPDTDHPILQNKMAQLETLADALADQRLHLVEQYQRFLQAQQAWQRERQVVASSLEEIGKKLHAREVVLQQRERQLETAESRHRQLEQRTRTLQRHLEGWQARMTARESTWSAERERLLAELQAREKLAEQRLAALDQLHQRWLRRRRREVQWVQAERALGVKLRNECASLREEWLRRHGELEKAERALAERALAIEQFQQECIGKAAHPAAAARRLDRLRQRWAHLSVTVKKALEQERHALEHESEELHKLHGRIVKQADQLATQEAEFAQKLSAWERSQLAAHEEMERLRAEVGVIQVFRDRYEKQANDLRDEVERLARLLLDEAETVALAPGKAA